MPLICTVDADKVQVGANVVVGAMAQCKFTVPLNVPDPAILRLKLAVCPALTVCEADEPDEDAMLKSGRMVPIPDKATAWELPEAVLLIAKLAMRVPPAVGVNVTFTVQLPPTPNEP